MATLELPMSYQKEIRRVVQALADQHGYPGTFDVTVARPGSFEMKVSLRDPLPHAEQSFRLSAGLTPRVLRNIQYWFVSVLPHAEVIAGHQSGSNMITR